MGLGPTDDHGRHNNRAPGRWRQPEWSGMSSVEELNSIHSQTLLPSLRIVQVQVPCHNSVQYRIRV